MRNSCGWHENTDGRTDYRSLCVRVCDHTDESMRLHCEFDISVGAPADDSRDAVFNNFYSIAITK